tara:strand:- start:1203 stop:1406 length:204 start_codon:yes stop_codon:yes gene_type:complete
MLSKHVSEALCDVTGSLRNALAHAARNERPITINAIAKMLNDVESLQSFDNLLDTVEDYEREKDTHD